MAAGVRTINPIKPKAVLAEDVFPKIRSEKSYGVFQKIRKWQDYVFPTNPKTYKITMEG